MSSTYFDQPPPPMKNESSVQVKEADNINHARTDTVAGSASHWKPGFLSRFPLMGFGCLIASIIFSVLSVVVLLASNGKSTSQWPQKIPPNVILTILNGASSLCIAVAVADAVSIVWWRQALHGTTIGGLHNSWSFGTSPSSIFFNLRFFNFAALAALAAKLTIVDGALYQRALATEIHLSRPPKPVKIDTYPVEGFPITGLYNAAGNQTRVFSDSFISDVGTWLSSPQGEIAGTYGFGNCNGTCFVQAPGIGFVANCTNSTTTIDLPADLKARAAANRTTLNEVYDIFGVNLTHHWATPEKNYSWIELETLSYTALPLDDNSESQLCPAVLLRQSCELSPARILYPVTMQWTPVASTSNQMSDSSYVGVFLGQIDEETGIYQGFDYFDSDYGQIPGFEFVEYIDISDYPSPNGSTYVGGIVNALSDHFTSKAYVYTTAYYPSDPESFDYYIRLSSEGEFTAVIGNTSSNSYYADHACPYSHENPLTNIMIDLNSLMFITSDDNGYYEANTTWTPGIQLMNEVHYKIVPGFMWGAFASSLVCVLCILPAFWGFWELGRDVTLSPIEIANAFHAPIIVSAAGTDGVGAGSTEEVLLRTGKQKVKYMDYEDGEVASGTNFKFGRWE